MTSIHRIFLGSVLLLAAVPFVRFAGAALRIGDLTMLQGVIPTEARPGDVVTVTGFGLDNNHLKEIYLTNGELDYRVEILEQNNVAVRLRVPVNIPAGPMRFAIVIATRPELLEQPLFLKILPALG
ncbi:MAG TPA: hypothetical protein VIY49_02290 [Bryobacteraceae bacterium]